MLLSASLYVCSKVKCRRLWTLRLHDAEYPSTVKKLQFILTPVLNRFFRHVASSFKCAWLFSLMYLQTVVKHLNGVFRHVISWYLKVSPGSGPPTLMEFQTCQLIVILMHLQIVSHKPCIPFSAGKFKHVTSLVGKTSLYIRPRAVTDVLLPGLVSNMCFEMNSSASSVKRIMEFRKNSRPVRGKYNYLYSFYVYLFIVAH